MELFRALGALCEPPAAEHRRLAAALDLPGPAREEEHADVFLFRLYPYASVYLSADGKLGGEARDRIAGFWRALGLVPPAEPDHLAALLGLYAALVDEERGEPERAHRLLLREARRTLLHEHLLSWTEPYLAKLADVGPPAYRAWGALLEEALAAEAAALGAAAGLPAALREAPSLEAPAQIGGRVFLEQLLAPVRTGVILVSDDLAAAARALGLGVRIAERRYVLEALLAQDAAGTLGWLAEHAAAWSSRHESEFWRERAAAAAALLAHTATEAAGKEIDHAR